ncbi:acetyl-CoA carboxylase carboxyltransferase component [Neobacillus niacini]|uniref:acyl-CoA carboxylase subunit beta n=1 Tax=Neobacillus niacini TaxID=86668 RepID=UPI002854538B|nr:carboxyl transferase domain-containing protein [Neobacillus niacini]MDR7076830.1 acetyl-CoA carboxylase carboxyltransferase component [Neobacillus niacini]
METTEKKKPEVAALDWTPELEELRFRRKVAEGLGGPESIAYQHSKGKLTARERLDLLLDEDSFREIGKIAGKGKYNKDGDLESFTPSNSIAGTGRIEGRKLIVTSDDFTIRAGSSESAVPEKWVYAERMAHEMEMPLIRLVDTAGGSVKDLEKNQGTKIPGYPMWSNVSLLGRVPVVGVALGACAGLGALRVGLAHFSVMVKDMSQVFAAGPPVVKQGLNQDVTKDELGGWQVHTRMSGVVNNEAVDEADAFRQVRQFLSYMPRNVWEVPERKFTDDDPWRVNEELNSIIPKDRRKIYKPRKILETVFDKGSIFEIARTFGGSTITCLARLNGYTVGVMASDPIVMGGALTLQSARKMERFVDLCDTFHIPIINFVDQPGVMTGLEAERNGTMGAAMRAIAAIEQAQTPWCSIIVRRAFGVGGGAHGPKQGPEGRSLNHRFAWPSARWGSVPIEGGVAASYKKEIAAAEDPIARREELESYYHKLASPFRTAEKFGVVDIIEPSETRAVLSDWVEDAYELTKRHVGLRCRTMR